MSLIRRCPSCDVQLGFFQVMSLGLTKKPGFCPYCSAQIYKNDIGRNLTGVLMVYALVQIIDRLMPEIPHGKLLAFVTEAVLVGSIAYYGMPLQKPELKKDEP